MSDFRDDGAAAPSDRPAAEPPGRRYRAMAIGLAAAVVVLVIIDGAAPLWAPPLLRSLGWETAAEQPDPALLDRLYRIEAARNQDRQDAAKSATALQETAAQTASTMQQLDRRIAALEAIRDRLTTCIGCGCLSIDRCSLLNPGDEAGAAGPGAHYFQQDSRRA